MSITNRSTLKQKRALRNGTGSSCAIASRCVFVLLMVLATGCGRQGLVWHEPLMAPPLSRKALEQHLEDDGEATIRTVSYDYGQGPKLWVTAGQLGAAAEQAYARAMRHHQNHQYDAATNLAFEAAVASWKWIDLHASIPPGETIATPKGELSSIPPQRAVQLYHSAVTLLLNAAQQAQRYDPIQGILIDSPQGPVHIKTQFHGFAWQPADFTRLYPVGEYTSSRVTNFYRRQGWGVPLVVVRQTPEPGEFLNDQVSFAATAMLRPSAPPEFETGITASAPYTLELFHPGRITELPGRAGAGAPLAGDMSAPLAWVDKNFPRRWLEQFRTPDEGSGHGKLMMLEPYQPGKIPVVLIHGLLSEPLAWLDLANELMVDPEFSERYQIWFFRYPTGKPFLTTAVDLRKQMAELIQLVDPARQDPALGQTVLIGHSMGGLISKLLVSHSNHHLWEVFSNQPLETLTLDALQREQLQSLFYFQPQPNIRRVIFIGTPHMGSGLASTWVARLGINQVRRDASVQEEYDRLIADNPGIINPQFANRMPTSVDLLQPRSELLSAVRRLPVNSRVSLHTIVGINHKVPFEGDGDGVVLKESARHPGSETEIFVDGRHERLHSHPETVAEVKSILNMHATGFHRSMTQRGVLPLPYPESVPPPQGLPSQEMTSQESSPGSAESLPPGIPTQPITTESVWVRRQLSDQNEPLPRPSNTPSGVLMPPSTVDPLPFSSPQRGSIEEVPALEDIRLD